MNQTEIYDAFDGRISKTAIQLVDDEWRIVGNWCYVIYDGNNMWDVWICNPPCLRDGLGQRKVKNIICSFKGVVKTPFRELTGEAYTKVQGTDAILNNLGLLGIRKKRQISEAQRKKQAEHLKRVREVTA